jgi:hypothetical protein
MSAKLAIVLFAGPEMPCKLRHALLFARDLVQRGGSAMVILEGNAPQWLLECAQQFGALDAARALGLPLLADAMGHVSLGLLQDQGYQIVTL